MTDLQLDIVAWIICGLAFVFIGLPLIGSIGADKYAGYKDFIAVGIALLITFTIVGGVMIAITMAVVRVFGAI